MIQHHAARGVLDAGCLFRDDDQGKIRDGGEGSKGYCVVWAGHEAKVDEASGKGPKRALLVARVCRLDVCAANVNLFAKSFTHRE